MSNVGRGAIIFVAAVVVGAYTYASASDLDRNGALGTIVFSTAVDWAFFVLPVEFYLHQATDYVYPFHEDPYPALIIAGTGFLLAIYSLGFLLRAVFDRMVSEGWTRKLRDKLS
jgi:hypothetical protein